MTWKMLQLLFLSLIFTAMATSLENGEETFEGSAEEPDQEEGDVDAEITEPLGHDEKSIGDEEWTAEEGTTTIIIIAAVSVAALAIVAVIAILLFRRHLQNREQGVYAVPVEQGQKGTV